MRIQGSLTDKNSIQWEVSGSSLHDLYKEYMEEQDVVSCQHKKDSLNDLFYSAREKEDGEEMARIKKESHVYYSAEIRQRVDSLVKSRVKLNMDNAFGIYLYKSRIFFRLQPETVEDINNYRAYVSKFNGEAVNTDYFKHINNRLDVFEKCAIGAVAPEIIGRDTLDNETKLSDYRGKYVIVDFWSSGCKYCRLESPNLQKAMDMYGDKNFTILGVSSDWKKDLWMNAIHEDESYWEHLKIDKENISKIMDSYCITGIPHIILVDPQGKILAKDLREENIYEIPGKFIK